VLPRTIVTVVHCSRLLLPACHIRLPVVDDQFYRFPRSFTITCYYVTRSADAFVAVTAVYDAWRSFACYLPVRCLRYLVHLRTLQCYDIVTVRSVVVVVVVEHCYLVVAFCCQVSVGTVVVITALFGYVVRLPRLLPFSSPPCHCPTLLLCTTFCRRYAARCLALRAEFLLLLPLQISLPLLIVVRDRCAPQRCVDRSAVLAAPLRCRVTCRCLPRCRRPLRCLPVVDRSLYVCCRRCVAVATPVRDAVYRCARLHTARYVRVTLCRAFRAYVLDRSAAFDLVTVPRLRAFVRTAVVL